MDCPYCDTSTISVRFYFPRMEDETGYISPEAWVFTCNHCGRTWEDQSPDLPLQFELPLF